ncbi:MAG: crossover junction endodeoxyribonuclease [Deltaproteobacteria bacterium]|nr:MAG: crossover junction endodeoxyribonuclease [Deltaproteobacteria bacterium]
MVNFSKIIGFDPGLASTGVGIVKGSSKKIISYGFGCITTSPEMIHQYRIYKIFKETEDIIKEEKPSLVMLEDVFSIPEYPKSGILLGKVSGAILSACANHGVDVVEVQVRLAKEILTGNGKASKEQLEKAVREYLCHGEKISPFHASDALALAIIGIRRGR